TVVAADGLSKPRIFRTPNPSAVIAVDTEQTHTTSTIKGTRNPYWNEGFDVQSSVIAVKIFDQRKSKKQDRVLLGAVDFCLRDWIDIHSQVRETLTLDLRRSNDDRAVHGKLTVYLSTDMNMPVPNLDSPQPGGNLFAVSGHLNLSTSTNTLGNTSPVGNALEVLFPISASAPISPAASTLEHSNSFRSHPASTTTSPATDPESIPFPVPNTATEAPATSPNAQTTNDAPDFSPCEGQHALLPPGWERRVDPLGHAYYVDHNTRTTTWDRPSNSQTANTQAQTTTGSEALPAGWEERHTPEGRPYYVEDNTQTNTLVDPRSQIHIQTLERDVSPLPSGWEMRLTSTARVYFVDHNSKTTSWDDPRFPSPLDQNVPQHERDFHRKLIYFHSQPAMRNQPGDCQIEIRRNYIFEDSYVNIMRQTPSDLKRRLMITFDGEDGPPRSVEFFFLLSHEMFKPFYCLFEYSGADNHTLQISPASGVHSDHLNYFKFIGRIMGLAILHRRFLDANFVAGFYKMILKKKITLDDLQSVDGELYHHMTWMLENDITDAIDETFTTKEDRFGEILTIDLKPGGAEIHVTEENKREYVETVIEYRIVRRVKEQFDAFMSGFNELIPQELINVFDERELGLLIGGISDIDVDDWAEHTDYRGYKANDEAIQWFWKIIRGWSTERRSCLLQFATGTSRIPINGFKALRGPCGPQRFTVEKAGDPSQLPMSYPSLNRIDLPPYRDYGTLERKLTLAVEETVGPWSVVSFFLNDPTASDTLHRQK
ncbi:ubiquitin-protein ligase, partial [Cantharellus anzutake]|uniref:ubiquitin-protein ligase n=1 Tax=Cantharellus anzutake TaxID=1750568 RepID=UPI001908F1D5